MLAIALLTNLESGSGGAGDVAGLLSRYGARVSEFGLADVGAALAQDPDRLVVAGGDGSLACVAAPAARAGLEMAVIPTGTANDFARELGLPSMPEEACELAVRGTRLRRLDLAWMEGRPFLNVASLGLAPAAAKRASGLKAALGPLAYAVGALRAGVRANPVRCTVVCDGERLFTGEAWQVTVACTGAFGAGASVEADPCDGRLDVVVVEAGSRARLALYAYGLRTGRLAAQPGVREMRCREARIELDDVGTFNVDGEVVEHGSCGFAVEAEAVSVVVP